MSKEEEMSKEEVRDARTIARSVLFQSRSLEFGFRHLQEHTTQ